MRVHFVELQNNPKYEVDGTTPANIKVPYNGEVQQYVSTKIFDTNRGSFYDKVVAIVLIDDFNTLKMVDIDKLVKIS